MTYTRGYLNEIRWLSDLEKKKGGAIFIPPRSMKVKNKRNWKRGKRK